MERMILSVSLSSESATYSTTLLALPAPKFHTGTTFSSRSSGMATGDVGVSSRAVSEVSGDEAAASVGW